MGGTFLFENKEYHTLTHPQKRVLFTELLYPGIYCGNFIFTTRLDLTEIDQDIFYKALNLFIESNNAFRLQCAKINGEYYQYFADYTHAALDYHDFRVPDGEAAMEEWTKGLEANSMLGMNQPMYYFSLFRYPDGGYGFLHTFHHILADYNSGIDLLEAVLGNYKLLSRGENPVIEITDYQDYMDYENSYLDSSGFAEDKAYWLDKIKGYEEPVVYADHSDHTSMTVKRADCPISPELSALIAEFGSTHKASIFGLFMSALYVYYYNVKNQKDIVFGAFLHNRFEKNLEKIFGMFITNVPFRLNIEEDSITLKEMLKRISSELKDLIPHQKYPLEILNGDLKTEYNLPNLFDVVLCYHYKEFPVPTEWNFHRFTLFPLEIHVGHRPRQEDLYAKIFYNENVFSETEVVSLFNTLTVLVKKMVTEPDKDIFSFDLLPDEEKQKILYDFNQTKTPYAKERTLQELLEFQAGEIPEKPAVKFGDTTLSYQELNARANQFARQLRKKGVKPGDIVTIMVPRSLEIMIAIYGVLKSGAAYLPVDPDFPVERVKYIVEETRSPVIVTFKDIPVPASSHQDIILIDEGAYLEEDDAPVDNINGSKDLAYVIFTSGSTGLPKGVMIEHQAVHNFIVGITDIIDFSSDKIVLSVTTISFDIFVLESFLALSKGCLVVIANEDEQKDPNLLNQLIVNNNISIIQTTPSRMSMLTDLASNNDGLSVLTDILVGGEAFPDDLLGKLQEMSSAKIFNMYGPTETTVWSSVKELTNEKKITIGKPIANTDIRILNKSGHLQPLGIPGELCIGGDGIARGYFNRQSLTDERFIPDRFNGSKIYRTGDMAKWLPDGNIECLGRLDEQIKIRGFRVEPQEIEMILQNHLGLKTPVVLIKDADKSKEKLAAYINRNFLFSWKVLTHGLENDRDASRRLRFRMKFTGNCACTTAQGTAFETKINNISYGGINIRKAGQDLRVDDAIDLSFELPFHKTRTDIRARVAFVSETTAGLAFDNDPETLKLIREGIDEQIKHQGISDHYEAHFEYIIPLNTPCSIRFNGNPEIINVRSQDISVNSVALKGVPEGHVPGTFVSMSYAVSETETFEINGTISHVDGERVLVRFDDFSGTALHNFLNAYINKNSLSMGKLRSVLASWLPDYMIPSVFIEVDEVPLTPNGKIDRNALRKIKTLAVTAGKKEKPSSDIEAKLLDIWKEVLKTEDIGINDMITDLGGTSLDIIRINSLMNSAFEKDVPLTKMFKHTTISALAQYLGREETGKIKDLTREKRQQDYDKGKRTMKKALDMITKLRA